MESFIRRTEKKKKSRLTKSKEMFLCITRHVNGEAKEIYNST